MKPLIACAVYASASLALHVALVQVSGGEAPAPRAPRPASLIRVSLAPARPPEPPAPAPAPAPKPLSKPPAPAKPKPAARPTPEPSAPLASEPSEPAPAELTGTTLLGTGTAAWSAPTGNGGEREGAIGAGLSRTLAPQPVAPAPLPAAPATIPLAQLSRKPVPPPLGAALKRNYPERARQQGHSGDAKVRARIEPSGEVRQVSISSETAAGFGDACRRTLLASRWSAPLDDAGRPVATWINYRCKFRVDD
jgi:TonB family protein